VSKERPDLSDPEVLEKFKGALREALTSPITSAEQKWAQRKRVRQYRAQIRELISLNLPGLGRIARRAVKRRVKF
jgi:hypothetical protein